MRPVIVRRTPHTMHHGIHHSADTSSSGTGQEWAAEQGSIALVVDDEDGVRLVANVILQRMGFAVEFAFDGKQAVDMIMASPTKYSIVILDLTMPVMGGEEALELIRQVSKDLPVIVSSGYDEEDMPEPSQLVKYNAYLPKPYRMKQMSEVVAEVMNAVGK